MGSAHRPAVLGNANARGVELQLTARASTDGKAISYLETPAEFAVRADSAPPSDYAQAFARVPENLGSFQQVLHDMYAGLFRGDVESATATINPLGQVSRGRPTLSSQALDTPSS